MAAADVSRRGLSFRLAEVTGNKQSSEYRALGKYLNDDEMPEPDRAELLARELQAPELAIVLGRSQRRRDRLEELGASVAEILQNQREGLALMQEIREMLEPPAEDEQARTKRPRR